MKQTEERDVKRLNNVKQMEERSKALKQGKEQFYNNLAGERRIL